jgi:hypothetical protein
MPTVVVIAIVLAVVVGAVWAIYRRGADEHSVEGYKHTLDALQGIRAKSNSGSVRVLGPSSGLPRVAILREGETEQRPESPKVVPAPDQGLVFNDVGETGEVGERDFPTTQRSKDRAMGAMNNRPKRLAAPVLAGSIVVAFLVALAIIGAHSPRTHPAAARGAQRPLVNAHVHHPNAAATTTTVPLQFRPTRATSGSATYAPPSSSYTLTVSAAAGPCWIAVQTVSGTTTFAQTLATGEVRSFALNGVVNVTLGAPSAVTVVLDNEPVVFPAGYQNPFRITFQPAAPSNAAATSTATTLAPAGSGASSPSQATTTTLAP